MASMILKITNMNPNDSFDIPIFRELSPEATYNINWGDGNISYGVGSNPNHTYTVDSSGNTITSSTIFTVTVDIITNNDNIALNYEYSFGRAYIKEITSFGNINFTNLSHAFYLTTILEKLPTTLPSTVTSLYRAFRDSSYNGSEINSWDITNITNLDQVFLAATNFNKSLNNWDTKNVTSMNATFYQAYAFNGNISNWNTSNVTDMGGLFYMCYAFNQNISLWNTSKVTNMSSTFVNTQNFNLPLGSWNVSSVTNMNSMFLGSIFNQDISSWNTSLVTDMEYMFNGNISFNQPIGSWNTSNVTTMKFMFGAFYDPYDYSGLIPPPGRSAMTFNQDISNWNTSNVTNMSEMFRFCNFNQPLNTWNVSNVQDMVCMFFGARMFNQPLNSWNTSNVQNMAVMFSRAISFNQPLDNWNTSSVIEMSSMLSGNRPVYLDPSLLPYFTMSFNQDISSWDVSNIIGNIAYPAGFANFLKDTESFSTENLDKLFNAWSTQLVNQNVTFDSTTAYAKSARDSVLKLTNDYNWIISSPYNPCFLEGTKICCFINDEEKYIPIETMRVGTLVKTLSSGYKSVKHIGRYKFNNKVNSERNKNKLYKCSKEKYPELFEDLFITGGHSILVDDLSKEMRDKIEQSLGRIFVTEGKYRLLACIDPKTEISDKSGFISLWHFALENDSEIKNYGVYANGLLVESCSIRYLSELSGMILVE